MAGSKGRCGIDARHANFQRSRRGKLLSPTRRRRCVDQVISKLGFSERRACTVLAQHRSTQHKKPGGRPDEDGLRADIIRLASQHGRYGYRRITSLLRSEGWCINHKRVDRIWRQVPKKQPKRGRLRPCWQDHVWAYDFVQDRTHDGRAFRMLMIIDGYTRECLAIIVARKLKSDDVLQALSDLFAGSYSQ